MNSPNLQLLDSSMVYPPTLLIDLQPYPLFDYVCNLVVKVEKQLKVTKPFLTLFVNLFHITIKEFTPHSKIETTINLSNPQIRVSELLVSPHTSWKERSASSFMPMDISKLINQIERLSSLERLRKSMPLRKKLVMKRLRLRIILWSLRTLQK